MNKYKALLFDLDGTLLDTSEGIISSVKYAIECTGLEPLSDDKIKSFIGPPIQNTFRKFYNLNDEETSKISAIFRERYSTVDLLKAKLYDSVLETLEILKNEGYVIGIATYKREDYAKKIVEYFGISQFCDVIEGSDFAGKLTKADIINTCIDKLGVSKNEILMIGDTETDKIGAENAGVDFLPVTYGFGYKRQDKKFKAINRIKDIFLIIQGDRTDREHIS